ncbi:hypothetical protein G7Y89_g7220 [Cudoniella acicularis]|uniref:Beta-glucuronidase C-terminal domain-containing protein n=1 Tax=Cudoniella acicularis TaxID=354080 RepID=A0A8H4W1R3_9HELO|nr:hypothetical protein G7Y89_g7220 [Cudoniella acicularis]
MKICFFIDAFLCATYINALHRDIRVQHQVASSAIQSGYPTLPIRRSANETEQTTKDTDSTNWAGPVVSSGPGESFNFVLGYFTVPVPSAPSGAAPGVYSAAVWVGIDNLPHAILQAGVDIQIDTSRGLNTASYYSWYEWYPDAMHSIPLDEFPVQAGHNIAVNLTLSTPTTATAVLSNLSVGKQYTKSFGAPSTAFALTGENAEWVVEDTTMAAPSGEYLASFADFGSVRFWNCAAGSSQRQMGVSTAEIWNLETAGRVVTTTTITSDSEFQTSYVDGSSQTPTNQNPGTIELSSTPPKDASSPIPEAFVSYSIEFASFPDFAGNKASPNTFSNNLLNNLGKFTGTKPYIRVGGNTQDYALYNASLTYALNGTINPTRATDYPTTVFIGPSYFESYSTWPDTKFIHGFNMALGRNNSIGWQSLIDTVPLACKALEGGKLLWWEYGNEPDLYSTSAQGPVAPPNWNESTYVEEWLNGTRAIKRELQKACPELTTNETYGYLAPSFAGTDNHLKPVKTWQDGLNADEDIKLISSHNYIGGATQPGITLQGTLMNHTKTVLSVNNQAQLAANLSYTNIPFILGETNSLYNQGARGLSNAFGAALWVIDFNLYCASVGIQRVHMHQGTNFRYQSWQPINTNITTKGTKAPYYGQIVVAAFIGSLSPSTQTQISNIPLQGEREAAYAAYVNGKLARVAVINLQQYNYTVNGTSDVVNEWLGTSLLQVTDYS